MKRIKTLAFCAVLSVAAAMNAFAAADDAGTSWLRIPSSTRSAAMGEALGAVPQEVDGASINPAGLGLTAESNLSIAQNFWARDISIQHFSYTRCLSDGTGLSLGGEYVNFGDIPFYRIDGSSIVRNGSRSPVGLNLYCGAGKEIWKGLRGGITGHFLYDDIQMGEEGATWAVDAGFFYQVQDTPFSASLVVSDLGGKLDDSKLPACLKAGASYRFTFGRGTNKLPDTLVFALEGDLALLKSAENALGAGAEYTFRGLVALRGGYRQREGVGDLDGIKGLSLGMGLLVKNWRLDYALTTIGDFGTAHQVALSLRVK